MKKIQIIFISVIVVVIYVFAFLILTNNKENSAIEGRVYTTFPKFEISKIFNDDYLNTVTDAFSDQIPFREKLVKVYYLFQFQRYFGDVVEGSDNQLFAKPLIISDIDNKKEDLKEVVNLINEEAKTDKEFGAQFIYVSIPRKDAVMTEYLPSTYNSSSSSYIELSNIVKENISSDVIYVDAHELFEEREYNYYYQTDHHVNLRGANKIYQNLMKIINSKPMPLDDYNIEKRVVNGSFNRQIGQRIQGEPEELFISLKTKKFTYTRYDNGNKSNAVIWGDSGSQYENAYMNGDYGETVVETSNKDYPNVLYVGSSYTNILEVLTIPNTHFMVSIDYRHNETSEKIVDYVKKYDIDYVIYIPGQSTDSYSISMMKKHLGV
ncbi:MAG TPA: hypothetical protein PLT65_04040 [Bacilli bacterium]|nr:hypothetical protein [Bacilli bacterium]